MKSAELCKQLNPLTLPGVRCLPILVALSSAEAMAQVAPAPKFGAAVVGHTGGAPRVSDGPGVLADVTVWRLRGESATELRAEGVGVLFRNGARVCAVAPCDTRQVRRLLGVGAALIGGRRWTESFQPYGIVSLGASTSEWRGDVESAPSGAVRSAQGTSTGLMVGGGAGGQIRLGTTHARIEVRRVRHAEIIGHPAYATLVVIGARF